MFFGSVTGERGTDGCPLGQSYMMERGNDGCPLGQPQGKAVTMDVLLVSHKGER